MINNSVFKNEPYDSRAGRTNTLYKSISIYATPIISFLAVVFFVAVDLTCLKVVWNLVQTESYLFVWGVAGACAVALDVPMSIAAIIQRFYEQGLSNKKTRNIIMILAISVFAIAFIFSFVFRIYTRDLSFQIASGSNLQNLASDPTVQSVTNDNDTNAIFIAAAFNGIIPLLTSISSFVISYFGANPLGVILHRLEKERVGIQSHILDYQKVLAEAESEKDFCDGLLARENDLFHSFLGEIEAEKYEMKQLVRTLLMEKLKTASDITALSKASEKLEEEYHDTHTKTPPSESPEFIQKLLVEEHSTEDEQAGDPVPFDENPQSDITANPYSEWNGAA